MIKQFRVFLLKTLHPQSIHCYEAPRSMLSNYFGKKHLFRGTFGKIWRIQIQMFPQTSFEPIYGAFTLKNKIIAHVLGLIV